ncbi:hypothetical protein [Magnetovibrio blakemorei]|uniref:Uncharacterized protein n=1 Tax=Magnetovibrio blakemorei TaxID=28181 RepID=A0A1E5Q3Y3_9PROT|nr:hypothetical protein [Magnetovibrio blakemorei]OEJ64328.1 hypothetical protein BEN30_16750 [Magnetovibrio blakemorei]
MVSDYLKNNRTIDELDALFEQDRIAAIKIAATVLNHEVSTAITNIGEINQIANARIMADSQVAAAKMMTDAEIASTHLIAKAELAVLDIKIQDQQSAEEIALQADMISEIGRSTTEVITNNAQEAVQAIQNEASEAITHLKQNATNAILMIKSLSAEISTRVTESAEKAKEKLDQAKRHIRTTEELIVEAEKQKQFITDTVHVSSLELRQVAEHSIANLHATTDAASKAITDAVVLSQARILEARDRALRRIYEIVGPPLVTEPVA